VPLNSAVLETKSFGKIGAEPVPATSTVARQQKKDLDRPRHPRRRLRTAADATTITATTSRPLPTRARGEGAGLVLLSRLVVCVTIVLAAVGALLGSRLLTAGPQTEGGANSLSTAFGSLQVGGLVVLARPDPKDMFGMPPGASHDEHAGAATVQVPVTLTNTSKHAVSYSLDSFRLFAGADKAGVTDTRVDGRQQLRPDSAISLRLTFFVPPAETNLLRYTPPTGPTLEVPLGAVAPLAGSGTAAHTHH
jgi:hypothetical protein